MDAVLRLVHRAIDIVSFGRGTLFLFLPTLRLVHRAIDIVGLYMFDFARLHILYRVSKTSVCFHGFLYLGRVGSCYWGGNDATQQCADDKSTGKFHLQ